jgi:hypothetical protein
MLIALVSIAFACGSHLYSIWDVQTRRRHTLDRLDWSGGTEVDRAIRDKLLAVVKSSTYTSLQRPVLVSATAGRHRELGYCVMADWISHAPIADGIQVTFRDGSMSNVKFIEDFVAYNESNAQEMVLFQGSVYRDEFPIPANRTDVSDVASIALLSGNTVCSNRVAVEYNRQPPAEPDEREPE